MANNTSVYADGAWKDVEHQYVNTADGWNKVSDTYVYSSAGWKKVHEEPYNWRLYGRTAASATAYLNGQPWKNLPQYRFTPLYNQSRLGNAYAGRGMPGDYNAARDGKVIWPYGSSAYANSYIGYYFTPTSDKITIRATCDNGFTVWLNQTQVLNGNSWPTWFQTTRTVVPGDPIYITINCRDWGVLWGACCRVANGTSINGTALLLSDTNWVSR